MKGNLKSLLDTKKGYVAVPRPLAERIAANLDIEAEDNLYFYLLVKAHYSQSVQEGIVWKRGEVSFSMNKIAEMTGKAYISIFRMMHKLEDSDYVDFRTIKGHHCFFLPYYEEHCGHRMRDVEQMQKEAEAKNLVDKAFELFWEFYHLQIPVPQVDYVAARKAYSKLSLAEQTLAIKNVERYYASLTSDKQAKWAVSYLKDKSFIFQETVSGHK